MVFPTICNWQYNKYLSFSGILFHGLKRSHSPKNLSNLLAWLFITYRNYGVPAWMIWGQRAGLTDGRGTEARQKTRKMFHLLPDWAWLYLIEIVNYTIFAEVVKLVDALDSKSSGAQTPCGFDSRPRHFSRIFIATHKSCDFFARSLKSQINGAYLRK